MNMTWQDKSDLIQKDPVTCARNFEHMVQLFIKDVLKSDEMPVREIVDFFLQSGISTKRFTSYTCILLGEGCTSV